MTYTVAPITDRTWIGTRPKVSSQFDTPWSKTVDQLHKEIRLLDARDFVIQMDITAADLKLNGELRANARPASDAVVVAFESKHGSLTYQCDQYRTYTSRQGPAWQHNVRGILLTLEALRAVDRYGATAGEQYTGFKALGAGRAMPASHMTTQAAYDLLAEILGPDIVVRGDNDDATLIRKAKAQTHPDRNEGARTLWDQVEQAAQVLGVSR